MSAFSFDPWAKETEPDDGFGDKAPNSLFTPGGSFILDSPESPKPLWGDGQDVLWSEGEALIIVGGQGLGKTTLAQQLALGRGYFDEYTDLLGFPIQPNAWGKTLYLAMDRPQQIARSFRRMVGEAWRDQLDATLTVWQGPPLADLAKHTGVLLQMAHEADAETVIVDSLKDAAIGLTDDEVGAGYNRARQRLVAAGIQVIELHHNRKAIGGAKASRPTIDDVYGSTWLTSGAGSVILLTGAPGDPIVGLHHLKQPADEVGPLKVIHDHSAGRTTIWHATDLLVVAKASRFGITAVDAAKALFETDKPTAAHREKARRRLVNLVKTGELVVLERGDEAAGQPTRWGTC